MERVRRDVIICVAAFCLFLVILIPSVVTKKSPEDENTESPKTAKQTLRISDYLVIDPIHPVEGKDAAFWMKDAQEKLARDTKRKPIDKKAKNIIFFLGDGMGVSTLTAAR